MNDITIITPPDLLLNDTFSLLLICPSSETRTTIQEVLSNSPIPINVFLFEDQDDGVEWVLQLIKTVDICILDLDNCGLTMYKFASHIIAQACTFYLTNDGVTPYNIISKNRVFDVKWLEDIFRGYNE